jgi:CRISPR-associated protein (TIGR03986 family)
MLRTAFEAVTNSRFGIFHGHDDRLAYRTLAGEGLSLVPARIEDGQITLLMGFTRDLPTRKGTRWEVPDNLMYAAWLPRWDRSTGEYAKWAVKYPDHTLPNHGDAVRAELELIDRPPFRYWLVREIVHADHRLSGKTLAPSPVRGPHRPVASEPMREVTGYVCVTQFNTDKKHDERVFFTEHAKPIRIPLTDHMRIAWKELIKNYQDSHQEERRKGLKRPPALPEHVRFSRQITGGDPECQLKDGTLCYARIKATNGQYDVLGLYPVMIARELFVESPKTLLSKTLKPAVSRSRLSPAERVFGWISQSGHDEDKESPQAYRGNLRIGPVQSVQSAGQSPVLAFSGDGVPLTILGQPKPQQVRFYVAENKQGEPLSRAAEKKDCYVQEQGLRGRKVYPHHAGLSPDYWNDRSGEPGNVADTTESRCSPEYVRPNHVRDDQNRSIKGWIAPKTEFTFYIHITNLREVELGALLWLLELNRVEQPQQGRLYHHRLGGGKPLGFGSVRLSAESLELRDGDGWADWYRSLGGKVLRGKTILDLSDASFGRVVGAFKTAVSEAYGNGQPFGNVPFIKAFLQAAQGFSDGRPIHYPRLSIAPDPDGKNFEWFVQNDRREHRYSLRGLDEPDPGLPRFR